MPLQLRLRKVDPDSCHWPGLRDTNDMNRAGSGIGVKLPPPAFSAVKSGGALKDTQMDLARGMHPLTNPARRREPGLTGHLFFFFRHCRRTFAPVYFPL